MIDTLRKMLLQPRTPEEAAALGWAIGALESMKPKRARAEAFKPPTLSEVEAFACENHLVMDCARFIDHFTSNGWKVGGKSPMKDWKAAVRNWAKNERQHARNGSRFSPDGGMFETIREALQ